MMQFPPINGVQAMTHEVGAQNADHFARNRLFPTLFIEVVCVLGKSAAVMACRSRVKRLYLALTRWVAC